ncbi:L-sorbosone dehydrogenase [Xanthomonas arboricola pv. pruni MAFF 301427]|nr:L-sorbosone dehydrogenase [Xanthomonas arboricola pv. pruni MAFF 301427]
MNAPALKLARWPLSLMTVAILAACGDTATLAIEQGTGPNPQLPEPVKRLIPTVKVAPVKRWTENAKPIAADDLQVAAFARDLDHPRWVYVLPNGDVLVAETAEPPKPEDAEGGGIRKKVQGAMMSKAGAVVPSANRITLLRDADGDGVAEVRTQFISGLFSPFGMA